MAIHVQDIGNVAGAMSTGSHSDSPGPAFPAHSLEYALPSGPPGEVTTTSNVITGDGARLHPWSPPLLPNPEVGNANPRSSPLIRSAKISVDKRLGTLDVRCSRPAANDLGQARRARWPQTSPRALPGVACTLWLGHWRLAITLDQTALPKMPLPAHDVEHENSLGGSLIAVEHSTRRFDNLAVSAA